MRFGYSTTTGESKEYSLPDHWIDVGEKKWLDVLSLRAACSLILKPKSEWASPLVEEHQVLVNDYLMARKHLGNMVPGMRMLLTPEVVEICVNEMQFLRSLPEHYKSMRPSFGWIFRGPKDKLKDWTWGRYVFAEEGIKFYVAAVESNDQKLQKEAMNRIFAILYAPFGFWNPWIADFYLFIAKYLPVSWKSEALVNYQGIRTWLQSVYVRSFKGGSGEEVEDAMSRLSIAMAGEKFGTIDKVMKAKMHDVMRYQDMLAEEVAKVQS